MRSQGHSLADFLRIGFSGTRTQSDSTRPISLRLTWSSPAAPLSIFFDTRYPDGRDVLLVIEVAMSSLPEDIGARLSRYALTLPSATYVVADIKNHQVLVHTGPRAAGAPDEGTYAERIVARAGESIRLKLGDTDLEPIPYEEVMR